MHNINTNCEKEKKIKPLWREKDWKYIPLNDIYFFYTVTFDLQIANTRQILWYNCKPGHRSYVVDYRYLRLRNEVLEQFIGWLKNSPLNYIKSGK